MTSRASLAQQRILAYGYETDIHLAIDYLCLRFTFLSVFRERSFLHNNSNECIDQIDIRYKGNSNQTNRSALTRDAAVKPMTSI